MAGNGLRWIPAEYDLGFFVIFARDLSPVELLSRLGVATDSAVPLSREAVEREEIQTGDPYIRAGCSEGWSFGLRSWGPHGDLRSIAEQVSMGTEAVILLNAGDATSEFIYGKEGEVVCKFDGHLPGYRSGSEPDLLLLAMMRLGMLAEPEPEISGVDAVLALAEAYFSLNLPCDLVESGELIAGRIQAL
ncbi:DUF6461 domain-containing protein [Kitasatospora sp. NPDC001175]|uniref:DUF6461 domain-containing protein n=1 Tax=Kitasatospora sp. NPDC001175 TaxID=3157103 RepID=UPI003D029DD5